MSRNYNSSHDYDSYGNRRDSYTSRGGSSYRGRGSYQGYQRDYNRNGYNGNHSGYSAGGHSSSPYQQHRQRDVNEPSGTRSVTTGTSSVAGATGATGTSQNDEAEGRSSSGVSTPNKYSNGYDHYERPSSSEDRHGGNDYRSPYSGRGGSYRGNYRGGYRGRGGSYGSPYAREGSGSGYQSSTPRQGSNSDLRASENSSYYHARHSEGGNHSSTARSFVQQVNEPSTPPVFEKKFESTWVKLLSLDNLKTTDDSLQPELIKLRDEREELFKKSTKNQDKLKDLKLRNLKLDFEIDFLKAAIARDQLNIDITQEKLDAISLI